MTSARILVVDDNAINLELVEFVLGADGFAVESASSAAQALARVFAFQPHLVLMDIQMPETDGLALTRQLKADARTRDLVIIAFTAYAMKGDEARMLAAGCDGYLSKPLDVATLAARVRAFIAAGPRAA